MPIPDKLVTAAAEAMFGPLNGLPEWEATTKLEQARLALAAAFAALPECDEAHAIEQSVADAYGSVAAEGTAPSPRAVVAAVFAALARMAAE